MIDDTLTPRKVIDTYMRSKKEIKLNGGGLYWPWQNIAEISDEAFKGYDFLEKAELPVGIEYIGQHAFANCINLKDVRLPEGLKGVWANTFEGCDKLEKLYLPDSIEWIYGDIFKYCKSLNWLEGGKNLRFVFVEDNNMEISKLPKNFNGKILNLKENPEQFKSLPTDLFWEYHLTKYLYNDIRQRLKDKINVCQIKNEKKQLENLLNTITYKIYYETSNLCQLVEKQNCEKRLRGLEKYNSRRKNVPPVDELKLD